MVGCKDGIIETDGTAEMDGLKEGSSVGSLLTEGNCDGG